MNDLNSLRFPNCASLTGGNYEWAKNLTCWDDLEESLEMLTMCRDMWAIRKRENSIPGMLRYSRMVSYWKNEVSVVLFGS